MKKNEVELCLFSNSFGDDPELFILALKRLLY